MEAELGAAGGGELAVEVGVEEAGDEGFAGHGSLVSKMRIKERAQGLVGAVEARFDDAFGDAEGFGGLACVQLFDVAEEHDVTEILGEAVDGFADEGEVFGGGAVVGFPGGADILAVAVAGEGGEELVDGGFRAGAVVAEAHEAGAHDDGVEPGGQTGAALELGERFVGLEEGFLEGVLGELFIVEEAAGGGEEACGGGADELFEGGGIARAEAIEEEVEGARVVGHGCHQAGGARILGDNAEDLP